MPTRRDNHRDGIDVDHGLTYHEWAEANGYDPVKRSYAEDTESVVSALPGAHSNVRRQAARKIA